MNRDLGGFRTFVLSHVSSSWRAVSLGLRELWTIIQVPYRRTEMVHEFARRAGDMRMELSAKSSWPIDLELDGFEISRLAVLVLEAAPAYSLFTSIETFGDRICLDKLVLYTSAKAFHILHLSGIRASRSMEIEGYPFSHQWFQSIRMSQLVSLSLTCIYVEDVNSLLSNLTAPLLREIKFDHLEINYGLESDVDEDVQPEDLVDLAGFKEQITTLTIIECRESAWLSIADHSIMSSLTSLTLVTDYLFMYGSDGDTAENSASTFVSLYAFGIFIMISDHLIWDSYITVRNSRTWIYP